MQNLKEDIGELFSNTFENHQISPEKEEWEALSATLQHRNFFRFNAQQFNVYYASTIVFCFLVCVGVGSHYTYTNFIKPRNQQESTVKLSDSGKNDAAHKEGAKQSIVPTMPLNGNKNVNSNSSKPQAVIENKSEANQSLVKIPSNSKNVDTIQVASNKSVHLLVNKDSIKTKSKRTLYITKQDTIFQFDTLHAPKQKKKWFK